MPELIWQHLCQIVHSSQLMRWFIVHVKGSQVRISKLRFTSVSEYCFIKVNSADPDEMPHFVAFHLSLHCLPKYSFRGFPCYIKIQILVQKKNAFMKEKLEKFVFIRKYLLFCCSHCYINCIQRIFKQLEY